MVEMSLPGGDLTVVRAPSSSIPSNWAQKWTPDEDERLLAGIREFGDKNWKKIAEVVGTRDPGRLPPLLLSCDSSPLILPQSNASSDGRKG